MNPWKDKDMLNNIPFLGENVNFRKVNSLLFFFSSFGKLFCP